MRHNSMKWKSLSTVLGAGHRVVAVYVFLIVFLLAGCATTPVGTRDVGMRRNYEQINVNALKKNTYSDASKAVLQRYFFSSKSLKKTLIGPLGFSMRRPVRTTVVISYMRSLK